VGSSGLPSATALGCRTSIALGPQQLASSAPLSHCNAMVWKPQWHVLFSTRLACPTSLAEASSHVLQAVFFKMRVAGVLHIFQFETRQGEDICTALQTHINDIMMKRYSKAKQTSNGDRSLPQANFGPKYEQHVSSIQKALEETKQQLAEQEKQHSQLTYERVWSFSLEKGTQAKTVLLHEA
jgi:hypothetical protein